MQSLPASAQKQAQIFENLRDPRMLQTGDLKFDLWNHDDQRHLCGAFRDNRVVPNEGPSNFTSIQSKRRTNVRLQVFGLQPLLHSRRN